MIARNTRFLSGGPTFLFGKATLGLLLLFSCAAVAASGSFTPAAGSIITNSTVVVSWTSDAPQQWVRAYANRSIIYDSQRLSGASGEVQFSLPTDATTLMIIYYERPDNGQWVANRRTYTVSIDEDGDSDSGFAKVTAALESNFCTDGEALIRTSDGQIKCEYRCSYAEAS